MQPDSLIPDPVNPQAFNRSAYAFNNPIQYSDPSGHDPWGCNTSACDAQLRNRKMPLIISRSDWGAHQPGTSGDQNDLESEGLYGGYSEGMQNNPDGYQTYPNDLPTVYDTAVIHHEGDDETYDVLTVQEAEMNDGFYDIGYHYIVGPDGSIYEGRDIYARGNHAFPNSGKIGILLLGDFNPGYDISDPRFGQLDPHDEPGLTQAQYDAAVKLVAWLDDAYGIDYVYGHKDVPGGLSTSCPGANAMPYVGLLQQLFAK